MAIPERLSRKGTGDNQSEESVDPKSDDTGTFETVSLDDQLAAEFEEDDEHEDLTEGSPSAFESDLVGGSEDEGESDVEPEVNSDSVEPEDSKKTVEPPTPAAERKAGRKGKATQMPRHKKPGEQPVEIDPKSKKLLPFGSTKKVLRTNDFEPRKNIRREQTLARYAVLALTALLVLVAGYQAVFPAKPLSNQEVYNIALQATNYTNFPVESGRGYATDFMRAYLTIDPDGPSSQVLDYYYTGTLDSSGSSSSSSKSTRTSTGSYNQRVLYGPTVYSARGLTDSSGAYTIAALIQPETVTNDDSGEATENAPRWMFFNVNVYFDEDSESFSITPESPTVVPAVSVKSPNDIPKPAPLGTGDESDELKNETESTVNGFIQGYMNSSSSDHSALDQYVVSNPDPELTKGLDGEYSLSDSSNAITYEVYPVEDTNELKVRVNVVWVASPDGSAESESRAQFTSTYVMTLDRQGDGRYLVSKFAPEYYVADPEAG